jgi:hypothetical protein
VLALSSKLQGIGLAVEDEITKELLVMVKKVASEATKAGALLMIELY